MSLYNIHPIFVHFPIALLFLYSVIKIIPFQKWFPQVSWRHIERALLVLGVLGAFAALATGDLAEELTHPDRRILDAHAFFAGLSTWIYGILLTAEIFVVLSSFFDTNPALQKVPLWIRSIVIRAGEFITRRYISGALAFLGLIALSITGLLGGVMVYGLTADPVAGIVLKILGL